MTVEEFERTCTNGDGCPMTMLSVKAYGVTTEEQNAFCEEHIPCTERGGACITDFIKRYVH